MKTQRLLVFVLVLQVVMLAGQWLGSPGMIAPAQAQVANPGADRLEMIDQLKSVNAKLDKLIDILQSGKLQVTPVRTDDGKDATGTK